jgi:ubiquinone/menaquinone biosynthesis C-methylase UbiE
LENHSFAEVNPDHSVLNKSFVSKSNVLYQPGFIDSDFSEAYLNLRSKESRLLPDELIRQLPNITDPRYKKEWAIRKHSLSKLITYLKKQNSEYILELGCGNGWLAHQLALSLPSQIYAIDVNEGELTQGARIFRNENLHFIYGDIFAPVFETHVFDYIIVAGTIQYFHDARSLITRLLQLLRPAGEIHILDSPFYLTTVESGQAKKRSAQHFNELGVAQMIGHYHHHAWDALHGFDYHVLHNPASLWNKLNRKFFSPTQSPFPWIKISG